MNPKIIRFAIEAHQNANHLYDGSPYSVHLAMVAHYAYKYLDAIPEQCWSTVMDATWLHDTIEDCRLTFNDVKNVAGVDVAEIVYALTNEKGKNRSERASEAYYKGIRETSWATYIKLCDRLANVRYSKETNSRMYEVYKKEHAHFIGSLIADEADKLFYKYLLQELDGLLFF
jgi:(p)ppGpp synthase/HD superfamily hydrolase